MVILAIVASPCASWREVGQATAMLAAVSAAFVLAIRGSRAEADAEEAELMAFIREKLPPSEADQ
jgi:hypothetical protein